MKLGQKVTVKLNIVITLVFRVLITALNNFSPHTMHDSIQTLDKPESGRKLTRSLVVKDS